MIASFRSSDTEALFNRRRCLRFLSIEGAARRKLIMLNHARSLQELRVPPGNHLEELRGDRRGRYSIRINDQWRVCFVWRDGDAYEVEIIDYH